MVIRRKRRRKAIYLYFNYNKKEFTYSTGIRISDADWDQKKKKIVSKIEHVFEPQLAELESKIRKAIVKLEFNNKEVTLASLREEIEGVPAKKHAAKKTLIPAFEKYLDGKSRKVEFSTYKKIRILLDKLKRFEQYCPTNIDPKNFTEEQYESFVVWLRENEKLSDNTIATRVGTLRNFLREENPKRNYDFIKTKQVYDNVLFLSLEELDILRKARLKGYLEKTRDLFLIGCLTGLRYSDYDKLSSLIIKNNIIEVMQQKTRVKAYVPCTKELKAILAKHNGNVPIISNQKLNTYLKILFKKIGLDRQITYYRRHKGKPVTKIVRLYDVITSHVARKTFIMTLLTSKVDQKLVMEMSGHKDYTSFKHYVTLSEDHLSQAARAIDKNKLFSPKKKKEL